MTTERLPIPPGPISRVRGRYQGPALRSLARVVLGLAVLAAVLAGSAATAVSAVLVGVVVAVPLLRLTWLVLRWVQERDLRFVAVGVTLLVITLAAPIVALIDRAG